MALARALEVGVDFPFVMQEQISFVGGPVTTTIADIGDLLFYGKFKRQLAEHWAGRDRARAQRRRRGSTQQVLRLRPHRSEPVPLDALSVRAASPSARIVGFLFNVDGPPDVFNWSVEGIVRGNSLFALRCEVNGRLFSDGGDNFNDIAVWPGLDFNLTDNLIIRPQAQAHLTNDAINWGLGLGFVFTM